MGNKQTTKQKHQRNSRSSHRLRHWIIGITSGIILIAIGIYIAFQVSPWPNALLIRYEFDKGGEKMSRALEKHVPAGIASIDNQQYRPNDKDAYLDVFYPKKTTKPLPTIVWVHGGAWVSGDKDEVDNYLKIIASYGFTTIGVNYSIAPEKQYPTPILQVSDALRHIQKNAEKLHSDPERIILAGDSAGSQIVAQVATIITNPAYARDSGITAPLAAHRLRAMILNCGAYDLNLPNYNGSDGQFLETVLWAYSGKKDFLADPELRHASVTNYVTRQFPPSYITAGNADPLEAQSRELAKKLQHLGVPVETLFYPKDHRPNLPHEYQFNLDSADGKRTLEKSMQFAKKYTR